MKRHVLKTAALCSCGGTIEMVGESEFIATDPIFFGGKTQGYISQSFRASCGACGLLYDSDHTRFSARFNEIKEKISQ
jgi:hypothetical protein